MVARAYEQFHKFVWIITYLGEHITGDHMGSPLQIYVLFIIVCSFKNRGAVRFFDLQAELLPNSSDLIDFALFNDLNRAKSF